MYFMQMEMIKIRIAVFISYKDKILYKKLKTKKSII